MRWRRRARIGRCNRCAPQRLFQLESRRAQPACLRIHRRRNIPERGCAARDVGDLGEPFRQRLRCDRRSGVSVGPSLHRRGKGHPEIVRLDRKTFRTSLVPEQRQRTPGSDAHGRQRMRDHWHQHPVCRGGDHGCDCGSTFARAEDFTISPAASEVSAADIMSGGGSGPAPTRLAPCPDTRKPVDLRPVM